MTYFFDENPMGAPAGDDNPAEGGEATPAEGTPAEGGQEEGGEASA